MHRIFGQKKSSGSQGPSEKEKQEAEEAKQVNLDKTVQNQEDRVKQLQAKYDSCNKDLAQYKKQLQNTKSPAAQKNIKQQMKRILQRRKMIDEQLNSAYSSLNTLSQSTFAIENAQMMQENLKAQKAAIHHMKEQHQQLDIDDIEDMQDDMAEILGDMEDVNDLMGRNFGLPSEVDDADLDAELDALGDELETDGNEGLEETLGGMDINESSNHSRSNVAHDIPSVPTEEPEAHRAAEAQTS